MVIAYIKIEENSQIYDFTYHLKKPGKRTNETQSREFTGDLVVKTLSFQGKGPGSVPGQGNWDPASCIELPKKRGAGKKVIRVISRNQ